MGRVSWTALLVGAASALSTLAQTAPQMASFDGSQPLPAGSSGVQLAQATGADEDLSQVDAERYDRTPGQTGIISFPAQDTIDSVELQLLFPKGGSESVTISQEPDAQLDTATVLEVATRVQPGACAEPTVSVGTTLVVCPIAGTNWLNVTWTIPFKSACVNEATVELAGASIHNAKVQRWSWQSATSQCAE